MVQDYRQNQIDVVAADTAASQAVRLLQVLNGRAQDMQAITTDLYERAVLISFSDYADAFRRVQEFLSFCDVIESKLEDMPPVSVRASSVSSPMMPNSAWAKGRRLLSASA